MVGRGKNHFLVPGHEPQADGAVIAILRCRRDFDVPDDAVLGGGGSAGDGHGFALIHGSQRLIRDVDGQPPPVAFEEIWEDFDLEIAGTGSLAFDTSGNLMTPAASAGAIPITVSGLADGAANMSFNWNLYDPTTSAPSLTQYAGQLDSAGNAVQDGSSASGITSITMGAGGQINAQYSNGTNVVVAQLALAAIQNPSSLATAGNNNFQASAQTSTPSVGLPNTAGRGNVQGGALESSTVDIATEFTNLIVFQRSYEASAKVVTTADTLSQDTIELIPAS